MQNFDSLSAVSGEIKNTSLKSASTEVRPSERVVQNILNFARNAQQLTVENKRIKLYLN